MNSKDAYDIALRVADLYLKTLQFFIAICTLFGGWIVTKGLPPEGINRGLLCAIFLASTGTLLLGQLSLLRRADAAIALSSQRLETEIENVDSTVAPLFDIDRSISTRYGTVVGMGGVIIALVLLIIFGPVS